MQHGGGCLLVAFQFFANSLVWLGLPDLQGRVKSAPTGPSEASVQALIAQLGILPGPIIYIYIYMLSNCVLCWITVRLTTQFVTPAVCFSIDCSYMVIGLCSVGLQAWLAIPYMKTDPMTCMV